MKSSNWAKSLLVASGILGGLGFLTAAVLQFIAGVQYRMAEDQGLQPGYSPAWIGLGTEAGIWLFVAAALVATLTGIVLLVLHRHRASQGPVR